MKARRPITILVILVGTPALSSQSSCATSGSNDAADGGPRGSGDDGGFGSFGEAGTLTSCNPCSDFPAAPLYDNGAPATLSTAFGAPDDGNPSGGPCLTEPQSGTLFPNNWLRPRFTLVAPPGQSAYEIRVHADVETNDLVVYTTASSWTMPGAMWTSLAAHVRDQPLTVTVRGVDASDPQAKPSKGSVSTLTIAPVAADGSMVYWATLAFDQSVRNTKLQGFHVGDESVVDALTTTEVQQKVRATWGQSLSAQSTQVQCIGCHTSTPDGKYAAFTAQWPWPNVLASVDPKDVGTAPSFLTPQAASALSPNVNGAYSTGDVQKYMLGIQTFSKAHYQAGDRVVVTTRGSSWYRQSPTEAGQPTGVVAQLVWFDLEATSEAEGAAWDVIARAGDPNSAAAPSWSHVGAQIAYASTDTGAEDGRMGTGKSDIVIVPYGGRKGGAATKLQGASDSAYEEYYPAYSADDALIAFNRVAAGQSMYNQPAAEVFVVPAAGGTPVRLAANDPVTCPGAAGAAGPTSPGVQNTWPKWAPQANAFGNKTYHWVIFSSTRAGLGRSQLYVTAVVVEGGAITTFPAIYLWNQDPSLNNSVPAWDVFQIPQAPLK